MDRFICGCCGEELREEDIYDEDAQGFVYCEGCSEEIPELDTHYPWELEPEGFWT